MRKRKPKFDCLYKKWYHRRVAESSIISKNIAAQSKTKFIELDVDDYCNTFK